MNSPRPDSRSPRRKESTANSQKELGGFAQMVLPLDRQSNHPGSLNDASVIRGILVDAIRQCGKSRALIAEEMSYLVGREVTERQLNGFTAESKEDYRFPSELERAFCAVTGDNRLLTFRAQAAGLRVVTEAEMELLELGRAWLRQKRAAEQIAAIEAQLKGVDL